MTRERLYPAKRDVIVYDYVDEAVPVLKRMGEKRVRGYNGLGYSIDNAPIDLIEVSSKMPLIHA